MRAPKKCAVFNDNFLSAFLNIHVVVDIDRKLRQKCIWMYKLTTNETPKQHLVMTIFVNSKRVMHSNIVLNRASISRTFQCPQQKHVMLPSWVQNYTIYTFCFIIRECRLFRFENEQKKKRDSNEAIFVGWNRKGSRSFQINSINNRKCALNRGKFQLLIIFSVF